MFLRDPLHRIINALPPPPLHILPEPTNLIRILALRLDVLLRPSLSALYFLTIRISRFHTCGGQTSPRFVAGDEDVRLSDEDGVHSSTSELCPDLFDALCERVKRGEASMARRIARTPGREVATADVQGYELRTGKESPILGFSSWQSIFKRT